MSGAKQNASINLARDICLKLIERRAIAPDQLAGAMALLSGNAEKLFLETRDGGGLWLVRLGRDLTVKMIECSLIGSLGAASAALTENVRLLAGISARLDRESAPAALNAARDLSLKLLETGRLSRAALPELLEELALSVGASLKEEPE